MRASPDFHSGHQAQIAEELDRVAEPVIVEYEHALGLRARALPGRKARSERLAERPSLEPARLIALKAIFEVSERQHETAPARDSLAAAELGGADKGSHSFREPAKTPQRQSLTQERLGQARPRRARPEIGLQRLSAPIELQKRVAQIDRRFCKIMTKLERAHSRLDQLLEASKLAQSSGATGPGVRVTGLEHRRRGEARERFREPASGEQELTQVDMGDDEESVELEGAPVETHRGLRLAAFA